MGRKVIPEIGDDGLRRLDHECENPKLLFRYTANLSGGIEIKCPGCRKIISLTFNEVPDDFT